MPELNKENEIKTEDQKIKEDWILALKELMNQVKQWVSEDRPVRALNIIEQTVEKNEEYIGNYKAPMLVLSTDDSQVEILPIGRFAFGAIGRVDISNYKRTFSFLYSRKKGWVCLDNKKPLTKSLFFELFNQMA